MKNTLFLHIGIPKTGSTAIQGFLAINRPELHRHSVLYPGLADSHYLVAKELREYTNPFSDHTTETFRIFSEITAKMSEYHTIILSAEGFSLYSEPFFPNLLNTLRFFKIDAQVKIILFCRAQVAWLQSSYQQVVKKARYEMSFSQFSKTKQHYDRCDYFALATQWGSIFGKENLIVLPYDPSLPKNKIYHDFLTAVHLPETPEWQTPSLLEPNRGLSIDTVEFIRWLNILRIDVSVFTKIVEVFQSNEGTKSSEYHFIGREEAEQISRRYEELNRLVAIEYLNRPDGILFPHQENSMLNFGSAFVQHDDFRPGLFKQQIECIKAMNEPLLESLYIEIYKLIPEDMVTYNAKHALLSFLKKYLDSARIGWVKMTYPDAEKRDFFLIRKGEGWNVELSVSETNFTQSTFDFSPDCAGAVEIANQKVILESTGSDPYFSLQKCLGNFDSETFVSVVLESPLASSVQLYFQTRSRPEYLENTTIIKKTRQGLNTVCFIVDDPEFNGQLRLDPGNIPGRYLIHEIVVKSNAKSYEELVNENKALRIKNTGAQASVK